MCLRVVAKHHPLNKEGLPTPLVAQKNITVYKEVYTGVIKGERFYTSMHRGFGYEPGTHYYQVEKKGSPKFGIKRTRPFFLYNSDYVYSNGKTRFCFDIYAGLHSFADKPSIRNISYGCVAIKMVIPKGANYYIGYDGDIVSDELIFP